MSENPSAGSPPVNRALFVATILTGSFLLFLVQPMVARMALPRLGGAPNVWNSAMLVYQALLLAGYAYAHRLGKMPLRRAARIHLSLFVVAALTLPVGLVDLPASAAGWEVLWVPALFLVTIGPVFLLVSAQAPLMQRWYALHPQSGAPWALYAASNVGSFAGLIAYPLLAEPLLSIHAQSWMWSLGYGLLIILVALTARTRWQVDRAVRTAGDMPHADEAEAEAVGWRRILLWLALSAIPSGLMLSTTTHLTTDLFAMPLLWVIPLGLYLLSFAIAFADRRDMAHVTTQSAPLILLLAGSTAMVSRSSGSMVLAMAAVAMLFVVAVALHSRLYDSRPSPSQLTLFYLVMSAGGALGGLFTALIAPVVFDWVWEHPLLVIGAALLMPVGTLFDWRRLPDLDPNMARLAVAVLLAIAMFLSWQLYGHSRLAEPSPMKLFYTFGIVMIGMALVPWRAAFVALLVMLMFAQGGIETASATLDGARTRSYFGIYTVRDYPANKIRTLAHGTTLHGQQSLDKALECAPMTYYGPGSGVGIALGNVRELYGPNARIGVVGLGTGTLAAFAQPGERWRFYEIDPAMLRYSLDGTFTYLTRCAQRPQVALGDARLELAKAPPGSFDVLAVDAFSSDAIPLHLLTDEAVAVYMRALAPKGLLLIHISNRYIDLQPVLAAIAKNQGLVAMVREDNPADRNLLTPSSWVLLTRDAHKYNELAAARIDAPWDRLAPPASQLWTDDHASILPYIRWNNLMRQP
jgi:SAM-dependent methyltransferase